MNKKIIGGIGLFMIAFVIFGGGYFMFGNKHKSEESQPQPTVMEQKKLVLDLWNDPAGFTFEYPKDEFNINKNEDDQDNYAHIDFTKQGEDGSLTVWVQDPPKMKNGKIIADLSTWIKDDKFANASIMDTTLGGVVAKKLMIPGDKGMHVTGAFNDGLLFWIESHGTSKSIESLHEQIELSFTFVKNTTNSESNGEDTEVSSSNSGGEEVVEEEIVE